MSTLEDAEEGEVSSLLELAVLVAINSVVLHLETRILALARPLKRLGPSLVSEPVADVVGVTGVDEDGNTSLEEVLDVGVERQHPVSVHEEVAVDIHVARVIRGNLRAESIADLVLV